jgi:predicted DNA-binding transcriptional regulator AlpA
MRGSFIAAPDGPAGFKILQINSVSFAADPTPRARQQPSNNKKLGRVTKMPGCSGTDSLCVTSQHIRKIHMISESLRNFDSLPDSAHVRQPVVEALYACSSASVWRGTKNGNIPKPHKFSARVTAWNVGELRAALALTKHPGAGCGH